MSRLARIPIRIRLALAFALAMALVLTATGAFLYGWLGHALDDTIDRTLDARARDLSALVQRTDPDDLRGHELSQVLGGDGTVLRSSPGLDEPLLTERQIRAAARGRITVRRPIPGGDEDARVRAEPMDTTRGARIVIVATSLEQRGDALENLVTALLIGGPLALVLASLAGYALAGAALRPAESMRREAEAVSASEPGRRLPLPPANDEIRRLGETLNGMLARLEAALARERRFVSDASHELRTPLAAMRAELELALRRERTHAELEIALRSAAEEAERLSRLADDLLVLARANDGKLPVRRERLAASDLFAGLRRRFERRASAAGRSLVTHGDGLAVSVDRLRAEQALGNLVENALRHGAGPILLEARRDEGRVELHVRDEGGGFEADFLAHAFEPFSRGDESRSGGGSGLGLAIVDVIARAHGGSAHAASSDGVTDVWLALPDDDRS